LVEIFLNLHNLKFKINNKNINSNGFLHFNQPIEFNFQNMENSIPVHNNLIASDEYGQILKMSLQSKTNVNSHFLLGMRGYLQ